MHDPSSTAADVLRDPGAPPAPAPRSRPRTTRAVAVSWIVTAGCATGFVPSSEAVNVIVDNRSARSVTVRAIHHVDLVDFEEEVPRGEQRSFRVAHRAFGDGPVAFELVTGPGRLGARYRGDARIRVPPGSVIAVQVDEDPRKSAVSVLSAGGSGRVSLKRW